MFLIYIEEDSTEQPQIVSNYRQVSFYTISFTLFCLNMKIYTTFEFTQLFSVY